MKKIIAFVFINISFLFYINFSTQNIVLANSSTPIFAKVENTNVYFYSSPIDNPTNQLFEIPQSYFVELLANAQDSQDLFYSARYLDLCGYVKKLDVLPVQGTPIQPFANNINFRIFALNGLDLKSSPNSSPFNKVISVPYLCNNLIYYGKITGEQMIPQKSATWFYCKFLNGTDTYYGYLYSEFCDNLSTIPQNTEVLPTYEGELFYVQPEVTPQYALIDTKPSTLKIVIIIAVCLPFLFVVYLIFKPTKLAEKTENSSHKKPRLKRLKRAEYYELDD